MSTLTEKQLAEILENWHAWMDFLMRPSLYGSPKPDQPTTGSIRQKAGNEGDFKGLKGDVGGI